MTDPLRRSPKPNRVRLLVEQLILEIRWLQLPLLLGLVIGLLVLELKFLGYLWQVIAQFRELNRTAIILLTLDMIDMVLIANLVVMVVISGYKIFISSMYLNEDQLPRSMGGATAGGLKVRIATTILLISSIHLLHIFLAPNELENNDLYFVLAAQVVFALTAVAFVIIDRLEPSGGEEG
ncbi:YqhA family protein [Maritimibacter alkaliphilus]|uniref:YqhA family protein n=1 Tax=Maritimibacter alkaliphilus TaxID=404236 RepID=UPI001C95AC09|nr:YqhA family protein [Maritimibacter alkaliphilus]MBY6090461.1 YqhA family protein [Maritimibacter alkaliphilus]